MGSLIAFAAIVLLLLGVTYLMFFRRTKEPICRTTIDGSSGPSQTDYSLYDNGDGGSSGGHHGGH